MDQIDDLERVVQDLKQQSNAKSLDIANSIDYEDYQERALQNYWSHSSDLKLTFKRMQTKSLFFKYLSEDIKEWPQADDIEEEVEKLKAVRKVDKLATKELENGIEVLAEEIQNKNKEVKDAISSLENKLLSVSAKRKQYEDLTKRSEECLQKMKERGELRENLKEMEEKHLQAQFAVEQCNTAVRSLEQCIQALHVDIDQLQGQVGGLKDDLRVTSKDKETADDQLQEKTRWLNGAIDLLEVLGGIKINEVNDDSVVLEILNSSLLLTLKFRLCVSKPRLCGAEVNIETLRTEDLVQAAVETGDVVTLVRGVKERFSNYNSLREEMDELQKNYAVDWEPSLGHIRVILGRSGKTVYTLGIRSSYPAMGSLYLVGVESKDQLDVNRDCLVPPPSCISLGAWIKHLHEIFSC